MLRRSSTSFRLDAEDSPPSSPSRSSSNQGKPRQNDDPAVGLKIIIDVMNSPFQECMVVSKSNLRPRKNYVGLSPEYLGILRECFLCKKNLRKEMDVYMYQGDQGFCSIECRCRQIFLDSQHHEPRRPMMSSGRKISRPGGRKIIPTAA